MNFITKIKNVLKSIKNSFKRFPVTISVSTALVIMLIILSEKGSSLTQDSRTIFQRINMVIALGIPLTLCIKLVYEKKDNLNIIHEVLGYILGAGILILYYFFLLKDFSMVSIIRYIGVSIFLYLSFSYISWIGREKDFEFYIIKVFSSFFLTVIYSVVLYLGIVGILFTIDQLFDIRILGKYYYYIFLIISGIFAPSLFLARIPEGDQDFSKYEYPKSLKVLLLYIVMPLITVYSIILYTYFVKIILTRNWPKGLVSHLVLWYSVISVAVIFFITPILKEEKWALKFKFWFPKLIIPILIMMFISIGIRIKEYGITENRYFVLVLGLWVLGMMVYFALTKELKNIVIPLSLSIIALNSVSGPLSSFSISKLSQNRRLQSILVRNNILEDDKIRKDSANISNDDKSEISMILKYFETNHSLEDVKYIPQDFKIDDMELVFGFPYMEKNVYGNEYFHYYSNQKEGRVFEVKGYDYLLESYNIMEKTFVFDDISIYYDRDNFNLKIERKDNILYEINFKEHVLDIMKKHEERELKVSNQLDLDDATIIEENDMVKVKIIINSFGGRRIDSYKDFTIDNIEYYILIKIK